MRVLKMLVCALGGLLLGEPAFAQDDFLADIPRKEVLIIENPQGKITNPAWFNIWVVTHGGNSNGLQQLGMDTLWYIDADAGIDGVWDNSLASEKPIYNSDFTEMTVKLRDGILWSDGVEFTRRRRGLHGRDADEESQHDLGTRLPGKRRHRDGS